MKVPWLRKILTEKGNNKTIFKLLGDPHPLSHPHKETGEMVDVVFSLWTSLTLSSTMKFKSSEKKNVTKKNKDKYGMEFFYHQQMMRNAESCWC